MTELKHIGEFIVNPANIAYMRHWVGGDGRSLGTIIYFNAFAAAANESASAFEAMSIEVMGKTPVEIMEFINNEPRF